MSPGCGLYDTPLPVTYLDYLPWLWPWGLKCIFIQSVGHLSSSLTVLNQLFVVLDGAWFKKIFTVPPCKLKPKREKYKLYSFTTVVDFSLSQHLRFLLFILSPLTLLPQSSSRGQVWADVGCCQHSIEVLSLLSLCLSPLFHSLESFCWITYFAWPKLLSEAGWQMLVYFTVAQYFWWKNTNFSSSPHFPHSQRNIVKVFVLLWFQDFRYLMSQLDPPLWRPPLGSHSLKKKAMSVFWGGFAFHCCWECCPDLWPPPPLHRQLRCLHAEGDLRAARVRGQHNEREGQLWRQHRLGWGVKRIFFFFFFTYCCYCKQL